MLTRTQFLFMLMLSIAGSIFAYALPDIVDWTFGSELGALLFCVCVMLAYIGWVGREEYKRDDAMNKEMHEERKAKVAAMLRDHVAKKVAEKRSTDYTDTSR
jgi:hypothetical protein